MVELRGVIGPESSASDDNIVSGLQEAFKDKRTQASSCASTPGEARAGRAYNDESRRLLREVSNHPMYAVVEDIALRAVTTSPSQQITFTSTKAASSGRSVC